MKASELTNQQFEDIIHEIMLRKNIAIKKTIVPPNWRPHDVVNEVNEFIKYRGFFINDKTNTTSTSIY